MINMICDNCGAKIDIEEEYCPNCGMELLNSASKPTKKKYYREPEPLMHENSNYKPSKKKYYEDSKSFNPKSPQKVEKPIKKRYYDDSTPESPHYSKYGYEYEESEANEDYEGKSSVGIGSIALLLFIALILGFIIGLLMFGSQSVPQIPGFRI